MRFAWSAPDQQTGARFVGWLIVNVIAMSLIHIVLSDLGDQSWQPAQGLVQGIWFTTVPAAFWYSRLPEARRLPAVHAIGAGGIHLATLAVIPFAEVTSDPPRWWWWAIVSVAAIPGFYLIMAGMRRLRDAEV